MREPRVLFVGPPRQAEIDDDRLLLDVDHDVGRFEIAVDNAALMGRVECFGQLENDGRRLALGRSTLLGQHVVQRSPLDERHRQIMDAVDLARVVDGAQVRMAERRRRAGLAIKPLEQFAIIVGEAGDFYTAIDGSSCVSSAR